MGEGIIAKKRIFDLLLHRMVHVENKTEVSIDYTLPRNRAVLQYLFQIK
jgi:hypothetical protein